MRHDQLTATDTYDKVNIAAVWPRSTELAPLPVVEDEAALAKQALQDFRAAPAAPDLPAGVAGLIVAAYAGLIAAFALVTARSGESVFMIAIAALFAVAFFTVPRFFLKLEPKTGRRPNMEQFLSEGIDTLTGHNSGRAVLVQMLIVPVFLTMAILLIGIATSIAI